MIGQFFLVSRRIKKKVKNIFTDKEDLILDIGCGDAPYYHKSIKGKIVGFDISEHESLHVRGSADMLPFKKKTFDKIISVNSFYYFKNPFSVAEGLANILKKDGKLIAVIPFFYPIHDVPHDKYRFTEYGIREILESNFEVQRVETIGGIFNIPAIMIHSLIKGGPLIFSGIAKKIAKVILIIFYPLYFIAQIFSLLDFLDKTKRFPTYYFIEARKK